MQKMSLSQLAAIRVGKQLLNRYRWDIRRLNRIIWHLEGAFQKRFAGRHLSEIGVALAIVAGAAFIAGHYFANEITDFLGASPDTVRVLLGFAVVWSVVSLLRPSFRFRVIKVMAAPLAMVTFVVVFLGTRILYLVSMLVGAILLMLGLVAAEDVKIYRQRLIVLPRVKRQVARYERQLAKQGIQDICPSRTCGHVGQAIHVCSQCGQMDTGLKPNRYGAFYHIHRCENPTNTSIVYYQVPTLDAAARDRMKRSEAAAYRALAQDKLISPAPLLKQGDPVKTRDQLERHCAHCEATYPEWKLPERLIAVVGGDGVGKTSFVMATAHHLMSTTRYNAHIAEAQHAPFMDALRRWQKNDLRSTTPLQSADAYQFRLTLNDQDTLLYYYDAPGSDYSSIAQFGRQEFVQRLDGIVLLIDPFNLDGLRDLDEASFEASFTPLEDIVETLITTLLRLQGGNQRYTIPVAVVITKADLPLAQRDLGAVAGIKHDRNKTCRQALAFWGADWLMNLLDKHLETIDYFACSTLADRPDQLFSFPPHDVMEPLEWIFMNL